MGRQWLKDTMLLIKISKIVGRRGRVAAEKLCYKWWLNLVEGNDGVDCDTLSAFLCAWIFSNF